MTQVNYAQQYPRFWLAYFIANVLVVAANFAAIVFDIKNNGTAWKLIGFAVTFVSLWPLYGFVRQRRYNPKWLWFIYFGGSALFVVAAAIACLEMLYSGQAVSAIAVTFGVTALSAMYVFALYQYLFRSSHLWQ